MQKIYWKACQNIKSEAHIIQKKVNMQNIIDPKATKQREMWKWKCLTS